MKVEIVRNDKNQPIGWEMSGETPEEIKKLRIIRDLQFWGSEETAIVYDGRRQSDDANHNPGILTWKQVKETNQKSITMTFGEPKS
jgi:hypothetical protein